MQAFIAPYKEKLQAIDNHVIGYSVSDMDCNDRTGRYVNWAADMIKWYGDLKTDSLRKAGVEIPQVDFGLMNVGGIRHSM